MRIAEGPALETGFGGRTIVPTMKVTVLLTSLSIQLLGSMVFGVVPGTGPPPAGEGEGAQSPGPAVTVPQTGQLQTTDIHTFRVLEATRQK